MAPPVLEFRNVTKRFGSVQAVDRMSFTVGPGEFFTLLGPSGCGKTTTLRLVAGLEEPDGGEILLGGRTVAAPERGLFTPPEKRQLGMVFQSYAVWPHLTVFENVAFPLRVRRQPAATIRRRVEEALESVGLAGLAERGATALSGGQQQRVALARALVYAPAILLLDEPLSNLDARLREQMRREIRDLQRRLDLAVLYVTHDQAEAMTLSDRIAVVRQGRFEQIGTPAELYEAPATTFVAEFLGRTIILEGMLVKEAGTCWFELANGGGRVAVGNGKGDGLRAGQAVRLLARPEDVEVRPPGGPADDGIPAVVDDATYLGDRFEYRVNASGSVFVLPAPKRRRYFTGSEIRLRFDPASVHLRPL
ncbi:MAG TPA: ABC transporter ATP-binding protein [candidate division Zixibacteria bacterium]|nr:ABC transporter ATP-binding protein [candidate division Zixibacteria bacterium]